MVRISSTIRRRFAEAEDSVGVLVKTGLPLDEATELVRSVIAGLDLSNGEDPPSDVAGLDVQITAKGPAVAIVDCVDLNLVLQRLATALTERGHGDAALGAMPVVRPAHGRHDRDWAYIKGFLALRGEPASDPYGVTTDMSRQVRHWDVTDDDLEAAFDFLSRWLTGLPGARGVAAVSTGIYLTPVPLDSVAPMLRSALRRDDRAAPMSVSAWVYAGREFRSLEVSREFGLAVVTQGHEIESEFSWPDATEGATEVLREAGPWCSYGHLTRGFSMHYIGVSHAQHAYLYAQVRWGPRFHEIRPVVARHKLYDAFGVMRLEREFADALPLKPMWRVTDTVASDGVLAQHLDLRAWFAGPRVDEPTLVGARERLAAAIDAREPGTTEIDWWAQTQGKHAEFAARGLIAESYWR